MRKLRAKHDWSQNDLAIKLQLIGFDVDRSTIAKIESRLVWVGDWHLFYFTRVFKVELDELFPPIDSQDPKIHDTLTRLMKASF